MNPKTKAFIDEWGIWIYRVAVLVIGLIIAAGLFEIANAVDPYERRHGTGGMVE